MRVNVNKLTKLTHRPDEVDVKLELIPGNIAVVSFTVEDSEDVESSQGELG